MNQPGCQFAQSKVDRGPRFDRKTARRPNQVIGKKGTLIRPDKRKKPRYL